MVLVVAAAAAAAAAAVAVMAVAAVVVVVSVSAVVAAGSEDAPSTDATAAAAPPPPNECARAAGPVPVLPPAVIAVAAAQAVHLRSPAGFLSWLLVKAALPMSLLQATHRMMAVCGVGVGSVDNFPTAIFALFRNSSNP